jgi:hypothetical protein
MPGARAPSEPAALGTRAGGLAHPPGLHHVNSRDALSAQRAVALEQEVRKARRVVEVRDPRRDVGRHRRVGTSTIRLPHFGSFKHKLEQPSPLRTLPSSQVSAASTTRLPQRGGRGLQRLSQAPC